MAVATLQLGPYIHGIYCKVAVVAQTWHRRGTSLVMHTQAVQQSLQPRMWGAAALEIWDLRRLRAMRRLPQAAAGG